MLGRTAKLEVPRRVVVYALLFSLGAIFWLILSVFLVSRSVLKAGADQELQSFMAAASKTVTLDYLRGGEDALQELAERWQRERSFYYCTIVSADGRIMAHSQRGRVGQQFEAPAGERVDLGSTRAVRFAAPGAGFVREYLEPLSARGETFGDLRVAVQEPELWTASRTAAVHAPLALLGPILFVALGTWALHRLVRPLSAVESQLRYAALAPTLSDIELRPIETSTAAAVGWNRIAEQFSDQRQSSALDQRLSDAVQALRQEKSDDVLNSLADGLVITDREGRITFANHAMAGLFSETGEAASLHGKTMEQVLTLSDEDEARCPLVRGELSGRHVVDEIDRSNGSVQHIFRVARSPIRSAERAGGAGHVWSVRDVTQQKLSEQMRNQFLDSATHELRTPLANIKAYAETLALSEMLDVENQKEFCNTINAEATRLARFIDDLLSISSMEVGSLALDRQDVDLQRLLHEVVAKVKPQMDQKRITFNAFFPEKYPQMRLDKDKLTIALVNLLGNAAKYTPEEGHVSLKVKVADAGVSIEVQDTGVGVSEEELPKIFEKFFRSSNPSVQQQTGTGLGLSMAHEVIRLHGGELNVQSELGKGSTFTAVLPLG